MSNWNIDGRIQLKGNSGSSAVYSGAIFSGPGALGGFVGILFDPSSAYVLIFDAAAVPPTNTLCDYAIGPVVGPNTFSSSSANRPMMNGCCWALSSTAPLYTPVSTGLGAFIAWTNWAL